MQRIDLCQNCRNALNVCCTNKTEVPAMWRIVPIKWLNGSLLAGKMDENAWVWVSMDGWLIVDCDMLQMCATLHNVCMWVRLMDSSRRVDLCKIDFRVNYTSNGVTLRKYCYLLYFFYFNCTHVAVACCLLLVACCCDIAIGTAVSPAANWNFLTVSAMYVCINVRTEEVAACMKSFT